MTSSWSIVGWTFSGNSRVCASPRSKAICKICKTTVRDRGREGGTAKSLSRSADCCFWFCSQKVAICLDCSPVKRTYLTVSVVCDLEDSGSCVNVHIVIIKRFNCVLLNMADSEIQHLPPCTSLNRLHNILFATTLSFPSLLTGNKPALIGCLSQECNLAKVEQHLIAIRTLLLSSIGRKNLNAWQTKLGFSLLWKFILWYNRCPHN